MCGQMVVYVWAGLMDEWGVGVEGGSECVMNRELRDKWVT